MKKTLIISLIIVIVGVLVGIYYWQKRQINQQQISINLDISNQQSLKTYTNDKYGMEFKYPSNWDNYIEDKMFSNPFSWVNTVQFNYKCAQELLDIPPLYYGLTLEFFNTDFFAKERSRLYQTPLTDGGFYEKYKTSDFATVYINFINSIISEESPNFYKYKNMNFSLDEFVNTYTCNGFNGNLTKIDFEGNPAYRYVSNGEHPNKIIFTKFKGGFLEIGNFYGDGFNDFNNLSKIFDLIISSFKFIK